MGKYVWTVVLAAGAAVGAYVSPELLAAVLSVGGAAALLAGRIAALTPNKTDDGIVAKVEEFLGRVAGGGTSGKASTPAAK